MVKSNIETYLRIKPSNENSSAQVLYEIKNKNCLDLKIPEDMRKGYVNNLKRTYDFKFNGIFDKNSAQEEVYEKIGKKVIDK